MILGDVLLEHERSSPHLVHLVVQAPLLYRSRGAHPQIDLAEGIEERSEGLPEIDLDGAIVHHFGVVVGAQHEDGLLRFGLRVNDAVQVELHRLGVEEGAVVELDILTKVEGVGQAVVGDLPGLGQARHELAVQVLPDQGVVDAGQGDAQLRGGIDVKVNA